ncbi:MAG: hypothetical protein ABI378_06600 [Chitinophagaceae bacterium]
MKESKAEELFRKIANENPGAKLSKMFGCVCIKAPNGKAASLIKGDMLVVKPPKDRIEELLRSGFRMFSPMGEGRPMNGWIEIPFEQSDKWQDFAEEAYEFVQGLPGNKKK